MRAAVFDARRRQFARFDGDAAMTNARMTGKQLDRLVPLADDAMRVLRQAMEELGLSARAYDKVRRVSRTIADLDGSDDVNFGHVAEAVSYRLLDRKH
jgi:magnesium chelatase family protein